MTTQADINNAVRDFCRKYGYEKLLAALTAAAEAGWSEFSPVQQAYIERKLELERERCAQVAETFPSGLDRIKAKIAQDVAAAIRALKG